MHSPFGLNQFLTNCISTTSIQQMSNYQTDIWSLFLLKVQSELYIISIFSLCFFACNKDETAPPELVGVHPRPPVSLAEKCPHQSLSNCASADKYACQQLENQMFPSN